MKVGFIGLGLQGAPMAERIAAGGYDLTVWARREQVRAEWAQRSVTVADTSTKLGRSCDVIGLCVTGDDDVTELVERSLLPVMRPGSIVVIHSTVSPGVSMRLGSLAARSGIRVLDAPVSGGPDAAAAGKLLLMVGGDEGTYQEALPVMKTYGDPVIYLGQLGNGLRAKIINNFVFIMNLATVEHASRLGQALGMKAEDLQAVLSRGSARSMACEVLDRTVSMHAAHVAGLFEKDLALAESLANLVALPSEEFLHIGKLLCRRLTDTVAS
jgi:3-hydroxyisobutyrate dehydrogenase-like beta-hydroxyacid dehydrogenase